MKYEIKEINGWPGYCVDTNGSVFSNRVRYKSRRNGNKCQPSGPLRKLVATKNKNGYPSVRLCNFDKTRIVTVHRLVLEVFLCPCPNNMVGCHNDGNPENNHISNLRWDTQKGNMDDQLIHGTRVVGEKRIHAKLNRFQVRIIRKYPQYINCHQDLADYFHLDRSTISRIRSGKIWRHLL